MAASPNKGGESRILASRMKRPPRHRRGLRPALRRPGPAAVMSETARQGAEVDAEAEAGT
jgi:hypothetical protein